MTRGDLFDTLSFQDDRTEVRLGEGSTEDAVATVVIGKNSESTQQDSVVIGSSDAGREARSDAAAAVAIGPSAQVDGADFTAFGSVSIGEFSSVSVGGADPSGIGWNVALGANAVVEGVSEAIAVGADSQATGSGSVALGTGSTASGASSITIGSGVTSATDNVARIGGDQFVFGGADGGTIADADLNNGEITVEFDEANSNFVIRGKDSTGTAQSATVNYGA